MNFIKVKMSGISLQGSPPPPPPPPLPAPLIPFAAVESPQVVESKMDEFDQQFQFLTEQDMIGIVYTRTKYVLQVGPTCGLVSLCIAANTLGKPTPVEHLFSSAVSKGFSNLGEMFSADNLAKLAQSTCELNAICLDYGMDRHVACILKWLIHGGIVLVPYDSDHNHVPICRNGHSAHWATIFGFGLVELEVIVQKEDLIPTCDCLVKNVSKGNAVYKSIPDGIYGICVNQVAVAIMTVKDGKIEFSSFNNEYNNIKFVTLKVFARQGKSKQIGIWSFDKLVESNNNLTSISPARTNINLKLPEGGIIVGLKGKCVVISK